MRHSTNTAVVMDDDIITDYAIGHLSPAKHIMVSCQSEISEEVAERVAFEEDVAATMMDKIAPVALSPLFMGEALSRLPNRNDNEKTEENPQGLAPKTLRHLLGHGLRDIKWKSLVPGVAVHDILGNRRYATGDRLYLLKAKGGMKMPEHSHHGEEWTLILSGSYSTGDQTFKRGDLHTEGEETTHSPYINEGEDCICLVMTQGPLKMKPFLAKLVQPMVGI